MKQLITTILFLFIGGNIYSQDALNIGLKFGTNSSKLITNFNDVIELELEEYDINHYFTGAFVRASLGRIYLQPEAYFNTKGGLITTNENSTVQLKSIIDYQTVDLPVLIGIKIIDKPQFNFRAYGGPLFSFVTIKSMADEIKNFDINELNNRYVGIQFGAGIDVWFLTLDARIENTSNIINQMSQYKARNRVYLFSAGIKLF